jgi:hypothetical protein
VIKQDLLERVDPQTPSSFAKSQMICKAWSPFDIYPTQSIYISGGESVV